MSGYTKGLFQKMSNELECEGCCSSTKSLGFRSVLGFVVGSIIVVPMLFGGSWVLMEVLTLLGFMR